MRFQKTKVLQENLLITLLCNRQNKVRLMPPKVKELITKLEKAGFVNCGGKGSHRNFVHPYAKKPITISGKLGDDAKYYQVRAVCLALEELKK